MILGPMLERGLRQSMQIFGGDPMKFFERPIAIAMLATAVGVIVIPYIGTLFRWFLSRKSTSDYA
jgi:putative tricarboxylic transport membrane protein